MGKGDGGKFLKLWQIGRPEKPVHNQKQTLLTSHKKASNTLRWKPEIVAHCLSVCCIS